MVTKTNHRGFYDWIVQRVSAILIGGYAVFILAFILTHGSMSYATWSGLFSNTLMRMATLIVVFAVIWHAWIGLWTVFTDYIKNGAVRLLVEIVVILALFSYLIWCLNTLWG